MLDPTKEGVHAVKPPALLEAMDHAALRRQVVVTDMHTEDRIEYSSRSESSCCRI